MATTFPEFPTYPNALVEGYSDEFDPGVIESPFERGLSKLRVTQKRVVRAVTITYTFPTIKNSTDFENWYFDTIGRVGWFYWKDHRGGATRIARFKGGAIGAITPVTGDFGYSRRTLTLEYLR